MSDKIREPITFDDVVALMSSRNNSRLKVIDLQISDGDNFEDIETGVIINVFEDKLVLQQGGSMKRDIPLDLISVLEVK